MTDNFQLYAKYYNLLYKDKNYNAEVSYVEKLIKRFMPLCKSILELGSGTGIHGTLLQKKGYEVAGVERSPQMVEQAISRGLNCIQADVSDFNLNRKFDVAVSLFHVVSYLTDNAELISAFKLVHQHLNSNGIFIFDVWYSPAVYEQRAQPRIKKMSDDEMEIVRFAQPFVFENKNVIDVQYTIVAKDKKENVFSEINEKHSMRHYSIPEINLLAGHTGFQIIHSEEFLTEAPPSSQTWGLCFVMKKI